MQRQGCLGVFSPLRKFPASTVIDKQLGITENGCELAPQAVGEELGVEVPLPWTPDRGAVFGWGQSPKVTQSGYLHRFGSQDNHASPPPWGAPVCEMCGSSCKRGAQQERCGGE